MPQARVLKCRGKTITMSGQITESDIVLTIDLSCLGHVIQLSNVSFMGCITKVTAIKNTNAIWEYDPMLPENHVLSGSLDVIVAVQTLAIKVHPPFLKSYQLSSCSITDSGIPPACGVL